MNSKSHEFLSKAISNLRPNCEWSLCGDDYDNLWWSDNNILLPPSKEEVEKEIVRLEENYKNSDYQRKRAIEYPSIQDQLDILYHQGYDGWKLIIDEVKNKYPKPNEEIE